MFRTMKNHTCAVQHLLVALFFLFGGSISIADTHSSNHEGARIFADRCVLCHGNYGAGDGFMPLVIQGYPETNLLDAEKSTQPSELHQKVKWDSTNAEMDDKSPPWNEELSASELLAVTNFIDELQEKPEQHWSTLDTYLAKKPIDTETGRLVFQTRCASCHGESAQGDGPMSAIIKSPTPPSLVASKLSEPDLVRIITMGGASVGRSGQMPSWKNELTPVEIDSVAAYIEMLRQ